MMEGILSSTSSSSLLLNRHSKKPTQPNRSLPTRAQPPTSSSSIDELRVCTNRTCARQGSIQALQNLTDLAPPNVVVNRSGCLGRCGSGPNVAVLPAGVVVGHCGTAAQAARLVCGPHGGGEGDVGETLEALGLRKRAEGEIGLGRFGPAQLLLSQAIDLQPFGGILSLYRLRSSTRLALGDNLGALEDARNALKLSPNYVEAHISEGDALMAMGQYDAAENSYAYCLQIDPSIRRSKSFKSRVANLQEKLAAATTPHD